MKFKLTINHLLFGLLVLVVIIGFFKIGSPNDKSSRKQEISTTGVSTNNIKEIKITAKKFSFNPNPIKLKLNEPIRFRLTTDDVAHGFSVPELGIDKIIEPGKEIVFDFTPTQTGKFLLMCSVQCGTGHTGMRGSIVVE